MCWCTIYRATQARPKHSGCASAICARQRAGCGDTIFHESSRHQGGRMTKLFACTSRHALHHVAPVYISRSVHCISAAVFYALNCCSIVSHPLLVRCVQTAQKSEAPAAVEKKAVERAKEVDGASAPPANPVPKRKRAKVRTFSLVLFCLVATRAHSHESFST